jgi:hypothetical protein
MGDAKPTVAEAEKAPRQEPLNHRDGAGHCDGGPERVQDVIIGIGGT